MTLRLFSAGLGWRPESILVDWFWFCYKRAIDHFLRNSGVEIIVSLKKWFFESRWDTLREYYRDRWVQCEMTNLLSPRWYSLKWWKVQGVPKVVGGWNGEWSRGEHRQRWGQSTESLGNPCGPWSHCGWWQYLGQRSKTLSKVQSHWQTRGRELHVGRQSKDLELRGYNWLRVFTQWWRDGIG